MSDQIRLEEAQQAFLQRHSKPSEATTQSATAWLREATEARVAAEEAASDALGPRVLLLMPLLPPPSGQEAAALAPSEEEIARQSAWRVETARLCDLDDGFNV